MTDREKYVAERLDGMLFSECVKHFAKEHAGDWRIDAAREQYQDGGRVEIDGNTIVSGDGDPNSGADIGAGVWVDGREEEDRDDG